VDAFDGVGGYAYDGGGATAAHAYLLPSLLRILENVPGKRIFEVGCGNGWIAAALNARGYDVAGIDPSAEGIAFARKNFPHLRLERGSAYDDLPGLYGTFPIVVSLEVVEHLFYPRKFAATVFRLLEPGGTAIVSTPYHGYWKNVALALAGRMDRHMNPLWDHGHIKFWSAATLTALLEEAGFRVERLIRIGRWAPFAKSMIAVAQKRAAA
jgi:2-polyprenyl-6-hydroxyphenyl methylase/3-demethylubiquinone-9 3-methyltransferase